MSKTADGRRQTNYKSRIENVKCVSYGFLIDPKEIEIGQCVTARYYKGFSNYNPENAVIVKIENE